jgi:hypothetical protein
MLKFYGSFRQGDFRCTIIEFADKGTLEDFFKHTPPPVQSHDIMSFWGNLFQLAKCLARMQAIYQIRKLDLEDYLHLALNPWKIFVVSNETVSPYSWKFKLDLPGPLSSGPLSSLERSYLEPLGEDNLYSKSNSLVCTRF